MSDKLISKVLRKLVEDERSPKEEKSLKFLLVVLAQHCYGDKVTCFPGVKRLARMMRCTERYVNYLLPKLVKAGVLAIEEEGGGRSKKRKFRLDVDQLKDDPELIDRKTENPEPHGSVSQTETVKSAQETLNCAQETLNCATRNPEICDSPIRKEYGFESGLNQKQNQAPVGGSVPAVKSDDVGKGQRAESPSTSSVKIGKPVALQSEEEIVRGVFRYYCEKLEKNPLQYTLTPARMSQGKKRLRESITKGKAADYKDPIKAARALMRFAIDALADSEWHVQRGHTDWEQIFRSEERMELWVDRHYNPPAEEERKEPRV
jgi:hypothetical protein